MLGRLESVQSFHKLFNFIFEAFIIRVRIMTFQICFYLSGTTL